MNRDHPPDFILRRTGLSRLDVLLAAVVVSLLVSLATPAVLMMREWSRRSTCQARLAALASGLMAFHSRHGELPGAARWSTSELQSLALDKSKRWDLFIRENWAIELLADINRADLAQQFNPNAAVAAKSNEQIRSTWAAEFICPADEFSKKDNPYVYRPSPRTEVRFARGNFAINGGTNSWQTTEGTTTTPTGDHGNLQVDTDRRTFFYWGNGIAGINRKFRIDDFVNGTANLVAFNEVRAGVSNDDIRGSWALGHIAASITWGHGVNGDAYGPNNQWERSDDIQGCETLHQTLGKEELTRLQMPCVSYIDINQNAASRSRHQGGVNAAFLDGAVRFVSNEIDPSLWHVIHSRETPGKQLFDDFATDITWTGSIKDAKRTWATAPADHSSEAGTLLTNSIGMQFVTLPAGSFTMGIADNSSGVNTAPPETPPHEVTISAPIRMSATEVTVQQFRQVMGMEGQSLESNQAVENDNFPVVNVSWDQAVQFCNKLTSIEPETQSGRRYRLPTEAEWEYACRSGRSESRMFTGSRTDTDKSGEAAGVLPALPLHPVASFPPNEFGLYDMRGNAWEWCSDWFDRDYYARSPDVDPAGPDRGFIKVIRGADWVFVGENCMINYPMMAPWKSSPVVGFRVICEQL